MRHIQGIDHPINVIRPFAWIATYAFCVGFWGFMALRPLL
jgi:hypothetical protein